MKGLGAALALMAHSAVAPPIKRTRFNKRKPGKYRAHGVCHVADNSSLRKLMRAARRGTLPAERLQVMAMAARNAVRHGPDYLSGHARRRLLEAAA